MQTNRLRQNSHFQLFSSFSFALIFALLAIGSTVSAETPQPATDGFETSKPNLKVSDTKKNVIVLLADDLGWGDVGFHDGPADTIHIDQLAKQGVELSRFYAYPACSLARAALLTGRFPHRYGVTRPTRPNDVGVPLDERILVQDFQAAGYQTSLIGKWHLGYSKEKEFLPQNRGFDLHYGFTGASVDYFKHTGRKDEHDWHRNGVEVKEEGYSTDLLVNEAISRIENRDKSKPFCILLSFNAPHSPFQAPRRLVQKYSYLAGQTSIYAAMIQSMDDGIGRILKTIDDQELRDNTVVVFTSDNGAARVGINAPFRGVKREVYEGGIHVPCVIRLPGVLPAGKVNKQLSKIDDIYPTLAEAAGIKLTAKKPLDGISLWKNLTNETTDSRSIVIVEREHTLIKDDWKLIDSRGEIELFNLKADPSETKNLAEEQPDIAAKMKAQLDDYKKRVEADEPVEKPVKR